MTDNALKAISETPEELRVGNYIVLFGGRDLTGQRLPNGLMVQGPNPDGSKGEYFSKSTRLDSPYTDTGVLYVDWEHGVREESDDPGPDEVMGYVDWKTKSIDERGIFVERVLKKRNKYIRWVTDLIKAGVFGTSTQAIEDGVKVKATGEIESWPLKRDTITVTPFEWRMMDGNALEAVKALKALGLNFKAVAGQPAPDGTPATQPQGHKPMVKPFTLNGQRYAFEADEAGNTTATTPEEAKGGPYATDEECIKACDEMNAAMPATPPGTPPPAAGPQPVASKPAMPPAKAIKTTKDNPMSDELNTKVEEQDKTIKALTKEVDGLKAIVNAPRVPLAGGSAEPRDPAPPFATLGAQLKAVIDIGRDPGANTQTQRNMLKAVADIPAVKSLGITESVLSDGGALLQPTFAEGLFQRVYDNSQVLGKTQKQTVGPNSNSYVLKQIDETSRATGSRFGGVSVVRLNAGGTIAASRPRFAVKELPLRKLVGLCYLENEALEDLPQIESEVNRLFPLEFDYVMQNELFNGDGASQMLGIFNSSARVSVSKETSQAAATIVFQNVLKMWSRMWGPSRGSAEWYVNQDVEPQLYTMVLTVGTGGLPVYLPPSGASGSPYATLFGRPVVPVEQASTLGTEGDISLVDWSQYLTVTKGGMKKDVSIHVAFLTDETALRFTLRANGAPIWASKLTPASGSTNTLSPYVTLATRS